MKEKGKKKEFSLANTYLNRHTNITRHKSCEIESIPMKEKGKKKQILVANTYLKVHLHSIHTNSKIVIYK